MHAQHVTHFTRKTKIQLFKMYAREEAKYKRKSRATSKHSSTNSNAVRYVRATWLLISLGICLTVVSQRLSIYFSVPTTTDTTFIQDDVVRFPPVILCPYGFDDLNFYTMVKSEVKKLCDLNPDCRKLSDKELENYPLIKLNFSIEMIWKKYEIDRDFVDFDVYMPFLKKGKNLLEELVVSKRSLQTIIGNCIEVYMDEEFYYKGYYTHLTINVKQHLHTVIPNISPNETSDIWVYIPSDLLYTDHELFYSVRPIPKYCSVDFQLTTQEFFILNLVSRPCKDETEVVDCENKCLRKRLHEGIHCSLPYLNLDNRVTCSTMRDIVIAYNTSVKIYDSMSAELCKCPKICNHAVHTAVPTTEQLSIRNSVYATSFSLRFANGYRATTRETYLFTFSALISDIGGNIGFFLGLSVLTALEHITEAVSNFVKNRVKGMIINKKQLVPVQPHRMTTRIARITNNY